jgi:hypothetical protein
MVEAFTKSSNCTVLPILVVDSQLLLGVLRGLAVFLGRLNVAGQMAVHAGPLINQNLGNC